jgi:hypothetical protein
VNVIQALVTDPRVVINQQDFLGRTTLMHTFERQR